MSISSLSDFADIAQCPRLVIKVGSALLVDEAGELRRDWLEGLAQEFRAAQDRGQEIVIVSSGAIALGAKRLGLSGGGRENLADAQAAAAVGQIALSGMWSSLLAQHEMLGAQLLLTLNDLESRARYLNVATTLSRLISTKTIPIINENDSVATGEIRFGDNDRLAARVAQACRADGVLLLSDIDGLYDRDPSDVGARHIPMVNGVEEAHLAMASAASASKMGTGGMISKLQAAQISQRAGIAMAVIDGRKVRPIGAAMSGSALSTIFQPIRNDSGLKSWLGGRKRLAGALVVDAGCAESLKNGGSLLAAGIMRVDGAFERGDLVAIKNEELVEIAKGLTEYGAKECDLIMGTRIKDQAELLQYPPRSSVIHRDHMVLL